MAPTKELNTDLTFKVRPLIVDDIDTIVKIDEKILRRKRSKLFHNQLKDQIEKHGEESFGAVTSEGALIGYLIAETVVYIYGTDDLSAWIILLGVDPKYQDQGIGTALVKQALDYFNQKGIKTIRTICAWNWGDLVEFFSSVGFDLSTYLTLELDIGS